MMIFNTGHPFGTMQLPFRYQFLLAPATIILLLAGLVAYTLVELPRINREYEIPRQWELATDRVLVMIATASHLDQLAQRMAATPSKRDELLFDYIEQTQIYLDNAQLPELLARAPEDIRRIVQASALRLHDPEHVDPNTAHATLSTLLPALERLSVAFQSQKRIALMDYHRDSRIIVAQLIHASLTVLLVCIVLGIGLSIWGLHATRRRLAGLTQRAHQVCAGDVASYPAPALVRDELDKLDQCLAVMTQRLINTVAVEKVLQGAEDERRRIAMDMHDGVLADLTALSRTLDQAENAQLETPPISELRDNVAALAESIRRVIDDLHPQSLEILGLEAALRAFLARHGSGHGQPAYHFEFDPAAENTLRPEQKIHLFRIASEAIHNVIRHAQCSRFEVSIRVVAQHLLCTVEDNGSGMPATQTGQGHGCLNIAERARAIGAQTNWNASRFSSGTRFELSLPLLTLPCPA
jgi:two-component system sensor histidine kinase UhpB